MRFFATILGTAPSPRGRMLVLDGTFEGEVRPGTRIRSIAPVVGPWIPVLAVERVESFAGLPGERVALVVAAEDAPSEGSAIETDAPEAGADSDADSDSDARAGAESEAAGDAGSSRSVGEPWYKSPVSRIETFRRVPEPSAARVVLTAAVTSILVSAATVIALARFAPQLLEGGVAEEGNVEVPSLIGMRAEMAGELLEGRGLRLVVSEERPDAEHEEGQIAAQDPLRGSRVDRGTAVSVVVSSGVPRISVPNVIGRTLDEARASLERAGLEVGDVREGGEGAPGAVVEADPEPGAEVGPGTRIELVVVPAGIEVPAVVGLVRRQAEEALTKAGLKVGRIRWRYNENRNPFTVLEQTPAAGTRAAPESAVELVLNEE